MNTFHNISVNAAIIKAKYMSSMFLLSISPFHVIIGIKIDKMVKRIYVLYVLVDTHVAMNDARESSSKYGENNREWFSVLVRTRKTGSQ